LGGTTNGLRLTESVNEQTGSPLEAFVVLTPGVRLKRQPVARATLGSRVQPFISFLLFILMGTPEAGQSAPENNAAQTTGKPHLKLRDGTLTVSVFYKDRQKGDPYAVIVPERAYKDKNGKWVNTSTLYEADLLQMAMLLMQTHARLRTTIEAAEKKE
jgi:hypothetical protein